MAEEPNEGAAAPDDDLRPGEVVSDDQAGASAAEAGSDDETSRVLQPLARKMGWAPKDQWRGDPEKWVDASDFIAKTAEINKGLKDQVHRISRATESIVARERRESMDRAQQAVRDAALNGDPQAIAEATTNLTRVATSTGDVDAAQAVADFRARHSWFDVNEDARDYAIAISNRLGARGVSVSDQMVAAEEGVRKRFPELFTTRQATNGAVKDPAVVSGGHRGTPAQARKPSLNDLQPNERREVERMIKLGMVKDAADYFAAAEESGAR